MQEEAAQRLVSSKPGDADFRAMNIRVQLYADAKYQFRISRFKYYPVPGVDGALVTFKLRPSAKWPALPSHKAFHNFVAQAFSGRRKMLRNSLQPLYSPQQVCVVVTSKANQPPAQAAQGGPGCFALVMISTTWSTPAHHMLSS
jgi:16S rRNA A1518/A1519 N6-dimethyltransferase RsmA/KsgA/DIM1 with predicted DNA glycosylase/AP lyase activity